MTDELQLTDIYELDEEIHDDWFLSGKTWEEYYEENDDE